MSPSTLDAISAGVTTVAPSTQTSSNTDALLDELLSAILDRISLPGFIMSPSTMGPVDIGETTATPSSQTPSAINALPDELLLAIFAELPLKERAKIRTVSKRWYNVVMDLGIHLEPLFVDEQLGVPFYTDSIPIRLNAYGFSYDYDGECKLADDLQIPCASLTRIEGCCIMHWERSRVLTDPPISTLALQVIGPTNSPKGPMHATLRATKGSGGIRFNDLLEVFDKMRAYDTKLSLVGWEFAAWFATTGDEVNYNGVCGHSTENRIEVRKCTDTDD